MKYELERAEEGVRELTKTRNLRWYPDFHIAARAGWINDPNGLSFFAGRYQVYFQHHPFGTKHGPMHWGHVSSEDLVTWRREPIAMAPSVDEDKDGVFSGSAVVDDESGRLVAYFTGNQWANGVNEKDGVKQVQLMADSKDGVHFRDKRVVIRTPANVTHFRDPKVWKQDDAWYLILGACSERDRGQVWLYTSENMRDWEFDQILFEDPDPDVFMLECPDMFPLNDKWVLTYCPMGLRAKGAIGRNHHNAGYVVGEWQPGEEFKQETPYRPADWGHDYYAPQSFKGPDGRRISFAWMGGFVRDLPSQASDSWSGQLTIPRVQVLNIDKILCSMPVPELKNLRRSTEVISLSLIDDNEVVLLRRDSGPIEIEAEFDLSVTTSDRFGFKLHLTPDGHHTFVGYDAASSTVFIDRRLVAEGDGGIRTAPVTGDRLSLRIFVDNGSIELFANGGVAVMSSFSFCGSGPRAVEMSSEGGHAVVESLKIHDLKSIWLDGEK
ncbi:glycoside hydrolase family 32 protein [Actinomycetaceae bacterium MB13-C1-2]|nr:glycoside hydrolase family 32 protein [Actinomycetaceae bacterium MB13-C1-2]